MWHSAFCASISGVNTFTPWITPHKFTPITHSQSFHVASQGGPTGSDAGVVEKQVHPPESIERLASQQFDVTPFRDVRPYASTVPPGSSVPSPPS